MKELDEQDKRANETIVAGAVFGALAQSASMKKVEPVFVDGRAQPGVYVWPDFMRSRYRLTVTIDPEEDDPF